MNSDVEIIARTVAGDTALFEILIRRNNAYLYRVARAQGFGHEDAQDLMQETYLHAFRGLGSFEHRSSFRTWVAEKTNFPGEVAEAALAHQNPNEVERAYQRGAMLDKRRKLMEAWGAYCDGAEGKVIPTKQ